MRWLLHLLTDQAFRGALERDYCVRSLKERELRLAQQFLLAMLMWGCVAPYWTWSLLGPDQAATWHILLSHVLYVGFGLYLLFKRFNEHGLRHYVFVISFVCTTQFHVALLTLDVEPSVSYRFGGLVAFQTIVFLLFLPYRNWMHIAAVTYFVTWLMVVSRSQNYNVLASAVLTAAYLFASNIQIFAHRSRRNSLIADFREKSRYIPHQVIRRSVQTGAPLDKVYPEEIRFCVCISSDWRGFQESTRRLLPGDVGLVLARYYENVNQLLAEEFPNGNYFYDWIADELFCVIFSESIAVDSVVVNAAVKFAERLMGARVGFERDFGFPAGIDIGMTAGEAVIGIFGPTGMGKATAFGEIAGQSRRIQTLGKDLRNLIGSRDRLLFRGEVRSLLSDKWAGLVRDARKENLTVRDVNSSDFFFIEADEDSGTALDSEAHVGLDIRRVHLG